MAESGEPTRRGSTHDDASPLPTAAPMATARRRFISATIIDSIGSGLWMPFALLFLVHAQHLSLVDAGSALSIGGFVGLCFMPFVGSAIDRLGVIPMIVASNVMRLIAFCCYPWVSELWQVSVVSAVVAVGDRLFWTVNTPMVKALTTGRESENMLASQTIARYVGAGVGSGALALLPANAGAGIYHLLAYVNAASYAVAGVMIFGVGTMAVAYEVRGSGARAPRGRWLAMLRERAYVGLCATNILFTLASNSKYLILAVLVADVLHGPLWVPGIAVVVGTVVIVVGQQPITRFFSYRDRTMALAVAGLLYAGAFASLTFLTDLPGRFAVVLVLVYSAVVSVAEAIFAPITTAAAADRAPAGMRGRASTMFQLSWGISGVIAPSLLAGLLSVSNAVLWLVLSALCLVAVVAVALLREVLSEPPGR